MAQRIIELDIFLIQLKKFKPNQTGPFPKRKTEKEVSPFSEFNEILKGKNPYSNPQAQFLQEIVCQLDTQFYHNRDNTKAISFSDNPLRGTSAANGTLWGIYKGGLTGENYAVFDRDNVNTAEITISEDKVTTAEYYFTLWLPEKGTTGILILQKFKHQNCNALIREVVQSVFCENGFRPKFVRDIPQQYVEEFLNNCVIDAIDIVRPKIDTENSVNPVIAEFKGAKLVNKLTKLTFSLQRFSSLQAFRKDVIQSVGVVIENFNEKEDEILVHYKNEHGSSVRVRLSNVEDMLPNYVLNADYFDNEKKCPIWDKLHEEVQHILKRMQYQIISATS